jgi:hypothetical protein
MNKKRDEKWLDEQISRTIDSGRPQFDAEEWKEKYREEYQVLLSRAGQTSHAYRRNLWQIITKSKIAKFAAAAVIVLAVGVFIVQRVPDEQIKNHKMPEVAKSPAEMMTAMSLNMAYRRGGMEEVEKQCDKAFEMLGPRPGATTVQEILAEFNGT